MKNVALFFINRPILVNFILIMNFLIGGYFIYHVPKEAFPGVSMNQIVIITKYPGASAKDVELNVTKTIEDKIAEIGNIKEFRSSSSEGISQITIYANDDLNDREFQSLLLDVNREIDKIDDLPDEVEGRPIITSVTTEDRPVMELAFTGSYKNLDKIIPKIEKHLRRLDGVSTVTTVGFPDEEIHVEVDAQKAIDKEIDLNAIYYAINSRNQVGTGGTLEDWSNQKKIISFNKYEQGEDVLNTVVRMSPDGHGVYLKDIATISYRPKDEKLIVRNNGKRGASILIAMRSGIDQLKISDRVKAYVQNIKLPAGVELKINSDVSDGARNKFALLKSNAIIGFILVLILLFYFLGAKPAIWTAFGIPFSIFGTIIFFSPLGMTLNSVSMGAFVILLGMIVDDAMVISERFDTNIDAGMEPKEAAATAIGRLWKPVMASSFTTIVAFMPLLAIGGLPGKFIWQMPVVVSIALIISLFECYFLLPSHLAHGAQNRNRVDKKPIVLFLEQKLESLLHIVIRRRYLTLLTFMIVLIGSIYIGATKVRKDSFPQEAAEGFTIKVTLQKGFSLEHSEKLVQKIEKSILSFKPNELRGFTTRVGTYSTSSLTDFGTEEHLVSFIVYLTPYSDRNRTAQQLIDQVKKDIGDYYKKQNFDVEFELTRLGPPLGKPFEIIISSNSNELRDKEVARLIKFLEKIDGVYDVEDDYIEGKNEINLKLDYDKVAQAGLTPVDIIRTLRIAFDGQLVTDYSSIDKSYDYRLRLAPKYRGNLNFIKNLPIANKRGQLIKLSTMIQFEERPSYAEVIHYDGTRSTSVTGNIDVKKITALEMLKLFKEKFKQNPDVTYTLSGRPVEEGKIFSGLKIAGIIALIGIYFILTLMYDSYSMPFLIISVVPFGVVGIFLSFYAHGLPLSMFAAMGLIGLSGIAVNDSVVLIDHIHGNIKAAKKFSNELVVQSTVDRLRPIMLTTVSTLLGLVSTAYALGGYDPLLSPLSLAILYGLIFSTTVVLILLPTLYAIGFDMSNMIKKLKAKPTTLTIILLIALGFHPQPTEANTISIKDISTIINQTTEAQIQNEQLQQNHFQLKSIDGLLDTKLELKLYKSKSINYPNPPITLDSEREAKGISLGLSKMTSFGVNFGLTLNLDDKQMGTIPTNPQFALDAKDSSLQLSLGIPLLKNFKNQEFHLQKKISEKQKDNRQLANTYELDKKLADALEHFWMIVRLQQELQLAQESLSRFKTLHALNVRKHKSGIISASELLTSAVEVKNKKRFLKNIQSKLELEHIALSQILEQNNLTITAPQMQAGKWLTSRPLTMLDQLVDKGLTMQLANNSIEQLAIVEQLEKERSKSKLDFALSLKSLGRDTSWSDAISNNNADKYEVYAGITFNLDFANTQAKNLLAKARSQKEEARYKKRQLSLQLKNLAQQVKTTISANDQQLTTLHEIQKEQLQIIKLDHKRFRNGKITTLDFVKSQESFDSTKLQILQLNYANELQTLIFLKLTGNIDKYLNIYFRN